MSSQYLTPGPWTAAADYGAKWLICYHTPGNTTGGEPIGYRPIAATQSNAALIASAPDLLACLQELSDWMRDHTGPADGTVDMLTRTHHTLAKARGEL